MVDLPESEPSSEPALMPSRLLAVVLFPLFVAPACAAEPTFERDVLPVLSRAGCTAGACHGNCNGKGGFRLSLKGEDPVADLASLTRDMFARRTDPQRPSDSLILQKATGRIPHEGGVRFARSSTEYSTLHAWISGGCRPETR